MQEDQIAAGFFHQHLAVGHVAAFPGQGIQLVIVGGKHRAGLEIAGQMFADGPGDRESIKGGGPPADFVEEDERALAGVM